MYTDNSYCHGPCIRGDWANDGTNDCSDGSDEENFGYDYDDNDNDAYDYDDDDEFKAIVSGFDSVDLNTVEIPMSNTLKLKVIHREARIKGLTCRSRLVYDQKDQRNH